MEIIGSSHNEKRMQYVIGRVISLKIGECAYIRLKGDVIRTSTVLAIVKNSDGVSMFETCNSFYCVTAPEAKAMPTREYVAEVTLVGRKRNAEPREFSPSALSEFIKKWRIRRVKKETQETDHRIRSR